MSWKNLLRVLNFWKFFKNCSFPLKLFYILSSFENLNLILQKNEEIHSFSNLNKAYVLFQLFFCQISTFLMKVNRIRVSVSKCTKLDDFLGIRFDLFFWRKNGSYKICSSSNVLQERSINFVIKWIIWEIFAWKDETIIL